MCELGDICSAREDCAKQEGIVARGDSVVLERRGGGGVMNSLFLGGLSEKSRISLE